jgi:hypothetical protein
VPTHLETTCFQLPAPSPSSHHRHQHHTPCQCGTICNYVSSSSFITFVTSCHSPTPTHSPSHHSPPHSTSPLTPTATCKFSHVSHVVSLACPPSACSPLLQACLPKSGQPRPLYCATEPLLVNVNAAQSYAQHGHGISSNGLALRLPTISWYSYLLAPLLSIDTIPYHFCLNSDYLRLFPLLAPTILGRASLAPWPKLVKFSRLCLFERHHATPSDA